MDDLERLARWVIDHGFSTGHGDTVQDILDELSGQIRKDKEILDWIDAMLYKCNGADVVDNIEFWDEGAGFVIGVSGAGIRDCVIKAMEKENG